MSERMVYVNGEIVPEEAARISALDRGFTLGDGVFDTVRAVEGRVFRLVDHLVRLGSSAGVIGLELPMGPEELSRAVEEVLETNALTRALMRITVSRGAPAERGLMPPANPRPTVAINATPFDGYAEERYALGIGAIISSIRRNESSPLSRIKSCCYLDSVLARLEATERGAEEALFLNTHGDLACGASSNLFLAVDSVLVTPPLESGVLAGITRRVVLELAGRLDMPHEERRVTPEELYRSQEAFVTNTALGVMPLVAVEGRAIGKGAPGSMTIRLRAEYLGELGTGR